MKLRSSYSKVINGFLTFALLLTTALINTSAARADVDPRYKAWTTVGSAGTIDEASTGKLVMQGSAVAFPEILPPTTQSSAFAIGFPLETVTATVRYNVVATDGLVFEGADVLFMKARFRDDGANAQVVLRLIEENIDTGATRILATLDSNAFAPSPNYQTQVVTPLVGRSTPDFLNNAYFIEATLIQKRSSVTLFGGKPGLEIIQLYKTYNIF